MGKTKGAINDRPTNACGHPMPDLYPKVSPEVTRNLGFLTDLRLNGAKTEMALPTNISGHLFEARPNRWPGHLFEAR